MLRSTDPCARAAATRVLCYWRDRVANPLDLLKMLADEHPAVGSKPFAPPASSTMRSRRGRARVPEEAQDRFLDYTLDQTMNTLEKFIDFARQVMPNRSRVTW